MNTQRMLHNHKGYRNEGNVRVGLQPAKLLSFRATRSEWETNLTLNDSTLLGLLQEFLLSEGQILPRPFQDRDLRYREVAGHVGNTWIYH